MSDNTKVTRYAYMVNNTKKEIRKVPFTYTPQGTGDNVGFVDGMFALVNAVKVGWATLTKDDWDAFDDINFLREDKINIEELLNRGYAME